MNLTIEEYILYFMSIILFIFWIVIWIMHICALTNANLKLKKRNYTSAAIKRKRKLKHLEEKLLPSINENYHNNYYDNNNNRSVYSYNNDNICNINKSQQTSLYAKYGIYYSKTTVAAIITTSGYNNSQDHNHQQHQQSNFSSINLPLPGVSIMKPIVGIDINLHTNLETFFLMDYPTYELLFCVQDPEDPAILVVENLFKLYPDIDATLFIGGARVGVNPKINNMQPAYEAIKYDLMLISDSGISMKKDTLLDMVGHMHDNIALVHQMPFVSDGRQGFQSTIEKVYFGTAHARAYLTADLLNINCPTGMSALMRKPLLDEVGGIKAFGQYLAEDFFFAKSFTDRGWKLTISSQPAWQNSANSDTFCTLKYRIQRWIKLRLAMSPQWTLFEPFSECILLGLLGAMSISFIWAINPFAIFIFHVLLWFSFDYNLLCTIQNGPLTFSKTDFILAWLIRECTALLIFLQALANPKVTWRSRIFKLRWGGYAEEVFSGTAQTTATAPTPINFLSPPEKSLQMMPQSVIIPNEDCGTNYDQVSPIFCKSL